MRPISTVVLAPVLLIACGSGKLAHLDAAAADTDRSEVSATQLEASPSPSEASTLLSEAGERRETHLGLSIGGLYACNDLLVAPESGSTPSTNRSLVSVVQGLTSIEILRSRPEGGYDVSTLFGPTETCTHMPASIAILDVNGDMKKDIVVIDPCRDWVALNSGDGGYLVQPLDAFFGRLPTATNAASATGYGSSDVLVTGEYFWSRGDLPSSSSPDAGSLAAYLEMPQSLWLATPVFSPFFVIPGRNGSSDRLVLQGRAAFAFIAVAPGEAEQNSSAATILPLVAVEPPYLAPFDGFDHLQLLRMDGCPDIALAVGAFRAAVSGVPRQLQMITFSDNGYYTNELLTSFDVTTFGMTTSVDGSVIVGILGKDAQGPVFGLAQVSSCGVWTNVGEWPTSFDWRTPDAPAFLDLGPTVPKTNGIRLLGQTEMATDSLTEQITFTNYDGFVVHKWSFLLEAIQAGRATPTLETTIIHEQRTDLAYSS
jgi:hypothetical protein